MSSKPKLGISVKSIRNPTRTLGMTEILKALRDSDLFDSYETEDLVPSTNRCDRGAVIRYNNKRILLDLWEYSSPTYSHEVHAQNMI